jgi:hypothetical protein
MYLDLEGCFGDLCDLRTCRYLQQARAISDVNQDAALKNILAERWAYDDISEDEGNDEDEKKGGTADMDDDSHGFLLDVFRRATTDRSFDVLDQSPSVVSAVQDDTDRFTADSDTDNDQVLSSPSSLRIPSHHHDKDDAASRSSQESMTVLYRDSQVADAEIVQYYTDIVRKGGNISLKSVEGESKETVL